MKYLIAIVVLLCCSCGTDPLGEENKNDPSTVTINGDQNQVNVDNQGPASNEQENNNADDEDDDFTSDQAAVDCCLARGNVLDENDEWVGGPDCYLEAKKYLALGCECVLEGEIRNNCPEEEV